jgi:signal transduction histidine kinase
MPALHSFFRALRHCVWMCLLRAFLPLPGYAAPAGNDTAEIRRLYEMNLTVKNCDSAIILFKELLPYSVAANYDIISTNILLVLGEHYASKGDYLQGLAYTREALPYTANLSLQDKANYFQHVGWLDVELGDYVTAAENYYIALDYQKKRGVAGPGSVSICNDLGEVYFRLHQNERALFYYNQGEEIARRNHYPNCAANIFYNKGVYYTSIHQLDSARKLYKKVNEIGERVNRNDVKAMAMEGIGKTFIESGEYEKAISYLQLAVHLSEGISKAVWIESSFYLGEAWYKLKKYKQAESILTGALKEAARNRLKDNTIKGFATLTAVYKATGQYTKALDCMDSFNVLNNLLLSAEKTRAINLMDIKYQTSEKDRLIANSQLLIARQNSKLAHKNMWILIIAGGVFLLLVVSAGVYIQVVNKQRTLERENKIGALKAAIMGGDDERRRIARELHDGIGGMLSAAIMRLGSMDQAGAAFAATPGYADAMNILQEMGDEIRKTAHNLMPEVLVRQSLTDAIRSYCDLVQVKGGLAIAFQSYGSFEDFTQDYKLNIYRIVQELVKNIIQHAGATHAFVQLIRNEHRLIVSIEDDGKGFDKEEIKEGQGLYNAQTRVEGFDGHFILESRPGKGTSVIIEFKAVPREAAA